MDENDRLQAGQPMDLDGLVSVATAPSSNRADERPEIYLGPDVHVNVAEVVATLGRRPDLFHRHGRLVRVADDQILELTAPALSTQMSRAARFMAMRTRSGKPQMVPVAPPVSLAKSIVDDGSYPGVAPIEGVTPTPVLRSDGSIVLQPGYDPDTRLFYAPSGPIPDVPAEPTRADAVAAVATLLDVVDEVCFAREVDRSAWLSFVLTLAARSAIHGPVPLFVSMANQMRTGKTQLVQWAGLIALGVWIGPNRWPRDRSEEELGKTVDAAVVGGVPLFLFDNIRGPISGMSLEMAVTTTEHSARILGSTRVVRVPQRTVFAASANGAQLAGDIAPRALPIRLFYAHPNPMGRRFRRPNLRAYIEAHQGELHAAALTIVSAFLRAGAPDQGLPVWGSREAWGALIRNALVWAGQPDPYGARDGIDAIDESGGTHDRLVAFIAQSVMTESRSAWTASDLADALEGQGLSDLWGWGRRDANDLAAELGVWDRATRSVDRRRLGIELRSRVDRPASNGRRITCPRDPDGRPRRHRTNVSMYTLSNAQDGAGPT